MNNLNGLRAIHREIASAVIISSDGYILMGRKDPARGGVYPDTWHIPGGGVEENESLIEAVQREIREETGLLITAELIKEIPNKGQGAAEKTLESGERVWCNMIFNRFEVKLDETAEKLQNKVKPGDDLIELKWFSETELQTVEQIPGGKEFFIEQGYIHQKF